MTINELRSIRACPRCDFDVRVLMALAYAGSCNVCAQRILDATNKEWQEKYDKLNSELAEVVSSLQHKKRT